MDYLAERYWQLLLDRYHYYTEDDKRVMRGAFLETVAAWPITEEELMKMEAESL